MKQALLTIFALTAFSNLSFANLITNGNFDTVDNRVGLANNRRLDQLSANWDVYSALPGGWTRLNGSGIEIQASGTLSGISAHSGNLYVELDSHPNSANGGATNSTMAQSLNLSVGNYIITFYYRPRTNTLNDNGIQVRLGTDVLLNVDGINSQSNAWVQYSKSFTVNTAAAYNVIFEATGTANQLGGFIDTVSLTRDPGTGTNEVPEPSTFALLGASLLAIGFRLRRRN